ncbi:structural maintenance of chromosomes protein 6-like [Leguminivora glycinivorella]|uniref:structural maintenance of chromosomes protein 6-like n=1 Tax=Leguminivora glycinivorella TaxID=1035111 RepID=UPI00200F9871|nr:structural maintenance of chromosomes protein 6-like [Leguminivora glycinivorella]
MDSDISDAVESDTDGSICSIHVRNFFCHDNLQIDLNKNVNFVVGRNGSGKSAILTALVVGLGGRASATNRGNNLHSFIKKGANSASVEIKIRNSSEQAYKHDVYGDYITIERHLNASGGSSYKVKNAQGKVISTKFDEVNNIITAHDIQVDNPISVLNQDDARGFHAADAKRKFTLFRKATNLDRTEANYLSALDSCKMAKNIWTRKSEAIEDVKKEKIKLKAMHDRLQSRSEIIAQEKALENEYYWSEVAQLERDVSDIEAKRQRQQDKIAKLEDKLKGLDASCGGKNGVIDTLKTQFEEHNNQRTLLEQQLKNLEDQVRAAQTALRGFQNTGNKHSDQIRREKRKATALELEIRNINEGDSQSQRSSLEKAAATAKKALDAVRARYSTAQHEFSQAQQNSAHCAGQCERARQATVRARSELIKLQQEQRSLQSRGNDELGVYGEEMVALCRAVEQAHSRGQFTKKPIGPVGAHLKVREKKWGGALEHVLGGALKSFLVNDDKDRVLLFNLMNKIYGKRSKPSVTCSKFLPKQHDVSQHVVRARPHMSALDSLVVTNPVVANFLIDSVGVERILMVPEHADAQRLSDRVENVPTNCGRIVTIDATEYYPAPRYRSYGGSNRRACYLAVSTTERNRQLLEDIKEAQAQLRELEAEEKELDAALKEAKQLEHVASRDLQKLLSEQHTKEKEERDARAALEQQQAPHQAAVLVEELTQSQAILERLNEQVEEWTQKEQEQKKRINDLERQMKEVKKRFSEAQKTCGNLEEEIEQEHLKQERGVAERQTVQRRLREDRATLQQMEAALDERQDVVRKKTGEAEMLCPRVDNPRDTKTVQEEIAKTKSKLNAIRTDGRSKAEVAEELLRVTTKYNDTKNKLDRIQALVEQCSKSTEKHRHMGYKLQVCIARRVQFDFNAMLSVNGYSGNMNIDFSNAVLEITCTGRESTRHASTTASLSGGERSYSTVAFIMALWACVELPFYFLDEFDVFMDNVNRQRVMNILLNHALKNPSRQFVFLTPQDASSVKAGPQISIHVMADPRP